MKMTAEIDLGEDYVQAALPAAGASHFLRQAAKIAFDVVVTFLALIVLAPVLVGIALLVKLDGGPAFYGHLRVGRHGRRFQCLKFRTMVVESDTALANLLMADDRAAIEWETTRKLRCDPRITPLGRFLRKTSLDELPQVINVLRLEMSLIGPRPIVEQETRKYGPHIQAYYQTRPGITGLWQVSGRSNTTYKHRVALDTWYVRNWSLWLDAKILLKTLPAVLAQSGAK
jgi:undecaprenyl-phosphate galactose phosphotransferase